MFTIIIQWCYWLDRTSKNDFWYANNFKAFFTPDFWKNYNTDLDVIILLCYTIVIS